MTRWMKVAGVLLGVTMAAACADEAKHCHDLEGDPYGDHVTCTPGEMVCVSNTRIRECGEDETWGEEETFICPPPGECTVMGGDPVCI